MSLLEPMAISAVVGVDVWRLSLDVPPSLLIDLERTLSVDERQRAERLRFDRDRRRFIAARGFLRCLLARDLGTDASAVTLAYGAYGKPRLPRSSHGLCFNIAHSGETALLAIVRGADVGVDVEMVRELSDRRELAEHFFSPSEALGIEALPRSIRNDAFFRCWTRKEAYIKGIGRGMSQPLDSFEVSFVPGQPAALLRVQAAAAQANTWSLHDISQFPNYAAAVAVRAPRARLMVRDLSL